MAYGIYVHIPFCVQKCDYCDFLSLPGKPRIYMELYVEALINEIRAFLDENIPYDTIYIGGGTPTALPEELLCAILSVLKPPANCEITVEANPGTLSLAYLSDLINHGVNRLSLGLQTTKNHQLDAINRLHSFQDFVINYYCARLIGYTNINVDLMFGLPGQTLEDWRSTLQTIIEIDPEHISAYSLTPAENTPLWDALENKKIHLPCEETDRKMYHMAIEMLTAAGYIHYELSNFAKPGYESRHNVNCWQCAPYRAFGLGGHSFDGKKRWRNAEDMAHYLASYGIPHNVETLSDTDIQAETMILGLRLTKGVAESNIPPALANTIETQIKKGLLTRRDNHVRFTALGLDLANQVFSEFI